MMNMMVKVIVGVLGMLSGLLFVGLVYKVVGGY